MEEGAVGSHGEGVPEIKTEGSQALVVFTPPGEGTVMLDQAATSRSQMLNGLPTMSGAGGPLHGRT